MTSTITIQEGTIHAAPEQVGMDSKRLQLLDGHFSQLIEAGKLQGASYLAARNGKVVLHRSLGRRTYHQDSSDLLPQSIRKVYSITKVVTAVAIVQLLEESRLFLHQPVADYLKEFDTHIHRHITIWHLLTHTSGLQPDPGVLFEPYTLPWFEWWASEKKKDQPDWTKGDTIKTLLSGRMLSKPGEAYYYCTAGFSVLAEIISMASGMPYEEYVTQHIFKPLGMDSSFFDVPDNRIQDVSYTGKWEENDLRERRDSTGFLPPGGNGMYSTLEDLWKFGQAILNGGTFNGATILGRRSVEMMVSNQLTNVRSRCWGGDFTDFRHALGWSLNDTDICSPGTFNHEGFGHCGLFVDPHEQLVFAFFVPFLEGWTPQAVINPRAIVWSSIQ